MRMFRRAAGSAARIMVVFVVGFFCSAALAGPPSRSHTRSAAPPADGSQPGEVIFSRSLSQSEPAQASAAPRPLPQPPVMDAERRGIRFVSYDLNVHLDLARQSISVLARMVLSNDGGTPRGRLPLQISSSLHWTGIEVQGKSVAFAEQTIASDEDHTGKLREAVVSLPRPWLPGQSLAITAEYQGTIPQSSQRLQQIGTPEDTANRSDWDRIAAEFVGLRGFGNVIWYPVVSIPAALGDGNRFFAEANRVRWNQRQTEVAIELTAEFLGQAPKLAILDGHPEPVKVVLAPPPGGLPGVVTARLQKTELGFQAPSLFLLTGEQSGESGITVFTGSEDSAYTAACLSAAAMVKPLIQKWLGATQKRTLTIVRLPESGDEPYEDGATLFTSNSSTDPSALAGMMVHGLAHAWFQSPYPWLNEGVPSFLGTLWLEQEKGRQAALTALDNQRGALALAEPADPDPGQGESLIDARDPIYYRTKAAYVFWMLRGLAGDSVLARAFELYNPAADQDGHGFERTLAQAGAGKLGWFFDDWVNRDRGLPDLSITGVFPRTSSIPGSYLVAVTVANHGSAAAEVPVSVRSAATRTSARLLVPANGSVTHRFLLNGRPIEASVNDGTVPEVQATVHRWHIENQPGE